MFLTAADGVDDGGGGVGALDDEKSDSQSGVVCKRKRDFQDSLSLNAWTVFEFECWESFILSIILLLRSIH